MDEPGPCIPNGDPFYSGLMKGDSDGVSLTSAASEMKDKIR